MRAFRVDTDHMTGAVDNISSAADRLGGGQGTLDHVNDSVEISMSDFRDRWKDEFGIISEMLTAFKEALTNASDTYDTTDSEIATAFSTPAEAPSDPSGSQAV
jgi:hypothetical protein